MMPRAKLTAAVCMAIFVFMLTNATLAEDGAADVVEDVVGDGEVEEQAKSYTGEARFRYELFSVDQDAGRFREDQWQTDGSTGGLEWLRLESVEPDANGLGFLLEAKALYDYDYDAKLLLRKDDLYYLKIGFSSERRHFDGSNEYWNEALYGLPGGSGGFGSVGGTSEHSDENLYIDRRNFNVELGVALPDWPELVFGWNRMEREGDDVLLRGARARLSGDPLPRFRGIPAVAHVDGVADTLYVEVAQTFSDKYNFRVRQEFEQYRDEQLIEFPRYRDGAVEQFRTFQDDPGYTNLRTLVLFDSFLDDETYVTANYMYNYLENDTSRNSVRPNLASPNHFVSNNVSNERTTNVVGLGYRKFSFLNNPDLYLSAGLRLEHANTRAKGNGMGNDNAGGLTLRTAASGLDELRLEETLRLVYRGVERTTLTFDAEWEQRWLDWDEMEDVQSHEIFNTPGAQIGGVASAPILNREADIRYVDQVYTAKVARRFTRAVKGTARVRIKDLDRRYHEDVDNDPLYYPGELGGYQIKAQEGSLGVDLFINSKTSATFRYELINETIDTEQSGETADLEIHRGAGSLVVCPVDGLSLVGTVMLENLTLESPGAGDGTNNIAAGSRPFDFVGDSYSILLNANWTFNEKTSSTFGLRHTEALGTVDYAGDYGYDSASVQVTRKLAKDRTLTIGYQFVNFNSHDGGDFDDYRGHGAFVTVGFVF